MSVRQGEIYYHDFGSGKGNLQSGKRPVLVIQGDAANASSGTTVIAAMTTRINKTYLRSHVLLEAADTGLKRQSMVLLEQVKTVNQDELTEHIGSIESNSLLDEITAGIKILYNHTPGKQRCLCRQCAERYITDDRFIIRRIDGGGKCEFCPRRGRKYMIQRIK